jgi:4-cresol dehydrogenase (hydroxylating) flavoprotein subunit
MDQNHQLDISRLTLRNVKPVRVTEAAFASALGEWTAILGAANVSHDEASGLLKYYDPWSLTTTDEYAPVLLFARHPLSTYSRFWLLPISILCISGRYHVERILGQSFLLLSLLLTTLKSHSRYGGSAPVVKGSVVLDLNLMNEIIEVNEQYAYVIVEPGVTFMDLYAYIQEHKLKLWMSTPALGWAPLSAIVLIEGLAIRLLASILKCNAAWKLCYQTARLSGRGWERCHQTRPSRFTKSISYSLCRDQEILIFSCRGYGPSIDGMFYQSNLGGSKSRVVNSCS